MSATFIRKPEDFVCEHCGRTVHGNGYTNHCPYCLYSKHVDIYPGDRACECGGLMEPVKVEIVRGEKIVTHRCLKCGYEKRNKCAPDDNFEVIVDIMKRNGY